MFGGTDHIKQDVDMRLVRLNYRFGGWYGAPATGPLLIYQLRRFKARHRPGAFFVRAFFTAADRPPGLGEGIKDFAAEKLVMEQRQVGWVCALDSADRVSREAARAIGRLVLRYTSP